MMGAVRQYTIMNTVKYTIMLHQWYTNGRSCKPKPGHVGV